MTRRVVCVVSTMAIAAALALTACAKREPYVPVVQAGAANPFNSSIYLDDPTGAYTMESVFPVEDDREWMARSIGRHGGLGADTKAWFADYLIANGVYAKEKSGARYNLSVEIVSYRIERAPAGIAYTTDFIYRLTSIASGKVVQTEHLTDEGTEPYETAIGARLGGSLGAALGGSPSAQAPIAVNGDDIELTLLKAYSLVIRWNVEKYLRRLPTSLPPGA